MLVLKAFLLCIQILKTESTDVSYDVLSDILLHILRHFNTGHVFFIYTDILNNHDKWHLIKTIQFLSSNGIESTACYFQNQTALTERLSKTPPTLLFAKLSKVDLQLEKISTLLQDKYRKALLLMEDNMTAGELIKHFYIALDSEVLFMQSYNEKIHLTELYHVAGKIQIQHFGIWSHSEGLQDSIRSLYSRRSDLQGLKFRTTSVQGPPMAIIWNGTSKIGGFFGEAWNILEHHLNVTTDLIVPLDKTYGIARNGSWNGMLSLLLNGTAEAGVGGFTISSQRAEVVDFTVPLIEAISVTYIRSNIRPDVGWTNFLAPFSFKLWLVILIAILLISMSFVIFQRDIGYFNSLHYVTAIFCQQGIRSAPSRCTFLGTTLTALVLYGAYSANLISTLAVQKRVLSFNSLEQFLQRPDFHIHVINTTALYSELQETSDPVLKQVYNRLSFNNKDLPRISLTGLQKVCSHDKFAFVTSTLIAAAMVNNLTCQIEAVPGTLIKEYLALVLAKNSQFRGIINHNLLIMLQSGILKRLHEKIWPQVVLTPEVSWRSVEIMDLASLTALLCFGIILSLLVLVIELFWKNIAKLALHLASYLH